jgi:hypothetical protein
VNPMRSVSEELSKVSGESGAVYMILTRRELGDHLVRLVLMKRTWERSGHAHASERVYRGSVSADREGANAAERIEYADRSEERVSNNKRDEMP